MKYILILVFILILTLFASDFAYCEWVEVGKTNNGFTSYIDFSRIVPLTETSFHIWLKSVTPINIKDEINGAQTDYSLQNFLINCRTASITTQRVIVYGKDGSRLFDTSPNETKPIEPESFAETMMNEYCSKLPNH